MAPPHSDSPPEAGRLAYQTLLGASLIALSGGALDAFLYLDHGKVFAGAMTGNAVLFGIALLGDDHHDAIHHAIPLLAFFVGVWLAEMLQAHVRHHAVTLGLACEITGLVVASFLPGDFPDGLFVALLALLTAYQLASFRKVDRFAYNCTFMTGNLRDTIVGLYQALKPECRAEGLRHARDLGLVITAFLVGAALGAELTRHGAANHTLWLPIAGLSTVLLLVLRHIAKADHPTS